MCWTTLMTQRWSHYYLFILFVLRKQSSSLLLLVVASLSPLNLSLYILLQLLASWDWSGSNVVKYRPWLISMAGIGLSPMVNFDQYGGISRHNPIWWCYMVVGMTRDFGSLWWSAIHHPQHSAVHNELMQI